MAVDGFKVYDRKKYLASVPAKARPIAERLCTMLEARYGDEIRLYGGFPIVVRDGEWLAGFAMRSKAPMVYCCSPHAQKVLSKQLAPRMAGSKTCFPLKAKGEPEWDELWSLVERVFEECNKGPGSISKTDLRKREAAKKASTKKVAKKAAPAKKVTAKKAVAKKAAKKVSKSLRRR